MTLNSFQYDRDVWLKRLQEVEANLKLNAGFKLLYGKRSADHSLAP